jgi:hypothetical protein
MDRSLLAAAGFSLLLVTLSYAVNRRLLGRRLRLQPYELLLTASAVFLLAILAESLINPVFESYTGTKLWEYRVHPLHDRNVSALAVLVWTAYGVHLYLTQQTLEERLPLRLRNHYGKALVIGFEAPLLFEVTGNLFFLLLAQEYYAYYLPTDLWHLTSLQVVPVYMICIFLGLLVLRALQRLGRRWALPPSLFTAGVGYLLLG